MRVLIPDSGGGAPSGSRETACALVTGSHALLLDAGSGMRRLIADPSPLDGVDHLDVVLTHFHFDHVCGVPFLPWLDISTAIWAPGAWLYGAESASILGFLLRPLVSPSDLRGEIPLNELRAGEQLVGRFHVRTSEQPRHWAPSVGLRIGDDVALITDTPYELTSAELADGVVHLLHQAWSPSTAPRYPERDSTAADAERVAREAAVGRLTLIHLDPRIADYSELLEDARSVFGRAELGHDELVL
jgi:ribonuclease BN (tRNA processing enzyme)